MDMTSIETFLRTTAFDLAVKVLAATAFWIVGRWLIGRVILIVQAAMSRNQVDPTLTKYLGSIITIALNIALVLGILGYFGVQTTSFAAMLAGAGVAIGAAWSGMLTLVGNGKIFGDTIQNSSTLPVRRVERVAQLAGGVDHADAIARLKAEVARIPNVAATPAPEVTLLDLNLLGPLIAVRPYCHTDHYWQVYFDTNEAIVRVCREAGWPAPAPTSITRLVPPAIAG